MGVGNHQLRLREDIVPVSTLQSATSRLLREVEAQRRPKVITRDGVAVAVLLGVDEFERLKDDASLGGLVRELRQAEIDIANGLGVTQEQLEQEFENRWQRPLEQ
jgi:prevent-host-death family protein